jgi:hypothetical protein
MSESLRTDQLTLLHLNVMSGEIISVKILCSFDQLPPSLVWLLVD